MDLPAHGLTGKVPQEAHGPNSFNETIDAVVNTLGIDSFVLGGNSMGGGATWRYTLKNPGRVQAMILVDSVGLSSWRKESRSSSTESSGDTPVGFYLLGQPWFRSIARYLDPGLLIEQGLMAAYNRSPVVDETLIARYYDLIMREGTRGAILQRGRSARPQTNEPDLSRLSQPTLIMWGAKDSLVPVSVARKFEQVLPNTKTIIYPDLGHIPMEEDPTRSGADVMEFLDRL
jgi:pimeloyl-ACP methyl ester carboxylesterase